MSESEAVPGGIPAGWYPDPGGSADLRWWNGTQWTSQLNAIPVAPIVQPSPLGRDASEQIQPTVEKAYIPFSSAAAAPRPVLRGIAYTRTVWWICFQPLWGLATQGVLYTIVTAFGPVPTGQIVLGFTVLNLALWGLLVRLAFADRRALVEGGNGSAASPWWILLSPLIYLIARARQVRMWEDAGAWAPVIWWVIALVISPGLGALGIFAAYGIFAP
jgi:hypothetical protein